MATKYQLGDSSTHGLSCVSLRWVSLGIVFIAINGPCVYFWVCLGEDNIQMREVHVNNYKCEDELEFFIQLLNKTALQEIGARDTVRIENPPLDSPTEEEVADDVIRVDVRHSQSSALKKLHDIIVTPIADPIEGNELTFLPEGPFCLIPFSALQDSDSSYVSDSFRICMLPSLTTLQLIHDCPADFLMKTGALLVGNPCFIGIIYQGRRLVQLPGARKEVEMIGRILNVSPPHWRNVLIGDDVNLDFKDIKRLKRGNILFIPSIQYKVTLNHNCLCMSTDTCVLFSFHLGYEFDDAAQSCGHVYDDNILVWKHDRSRIANFF